MKRIKVRLWVLWVLFYIVFAACVYSLINIKNNNYFIILLLINVLLENKIIKKIDEKLLTNKL